MTWADIHEVFVFYRHNPKALADDAAGIVCLVLFVAFAFAIPVIDRPLSASQAFYAGYEKGHEF